MDIPIGYVTHYYNRIGVAVVKLKDALKIGDNILILGHSSDFTQAVQSLEINHEKILDARAGDEVALKVNEPARAGDAVYRVVEEPRGTDPAGLWALAHEAEHAIVQCYQPVFERFMDTSGLDGRTISVLLAAYSMDPEAVTAARLQSCGPYTSASAFLTRLSAAAQRGYLVEAEPGEFRLTGTGMAEVQRAILDSRALMAEADPLREEEADRLAELLDRVVQASLYTPPPPDKSCIYRSFKLAPASSPPLPYTEQAISCLSAYRDDAHQAAWRPTGLTAHALEMLTLLWEGEADSLDSLCQRLAFRGHALRATAEGLETLRQRGLAEGPDAAVRLTDAGQGFRDQIERDTDRYFFTPWACLGGAERVELAGLFVRLKQGLMYPVQTMARNR